MDQVAQIREKIDIVSFITEFVPLARAGRNFRANCPFHNEKSPSFVVSPERQIWHCFGCQKGGDVYTFLMEYEHLEFGEALRVLAKRVGIELEQVGSWENAIVSQKEKIYKMNKLSCDYYHYLLTKHRVGEKAMDYLLTKRSIKPQVIDTFMLGFAPGIGNGLVRYLLDKKGYKEQEIIDAGLGQKRGRTMVDFFVDRLMFPLFDHRDNIVGFSGRIITESSAMKSKYVNTRETVVYHKGDLFFGIQTAKQAIKKENQAILVEGEFDVISCFEEGIANALAIKGTALTENQVKLLSRFVQKVTICFDGDKAGQEALKRSLPILEKKGMTTTVIVIPNGKDPDEAIKKDAYAFKKAVREDIGVYDYLFSQTLSFYDNRTAEGKQKITDVLLPIIGSIENEIIKEHFLKKLSNELDTTYDSIVKEIERRFTQKAKTNTFVPSKEKKPREEMLEIYIVSLIVQSANPKRVFEKAIAMLSSTLPKERAYQKIIWSMVSSIEKTNILDAKTFTPFLPQELLTAYNTSFLTLLPKLANDEEFMQEVEVAAKELKMLYIRGKIKTIGEQIKEKEKLGNDADILLLQQEFGRLIPLLQES